MESGRLRPRALRAGSRVALVAPAGPCTEERIEEATGRCAALGLESVTGKFVRERRGYLAGTDEQRLADLDWAFRDPGIDGVWALRGGYGTMRLLDRLDMSAIRSRPRAFIGFSDNTALHQLLARAGVVSFLGPHAGGPFPVFSRAALHSTLFDASPAGVLRIPAGGTPCALVPGRAEGRLMGGNLTMLASLCGSPFALRAEGAVVVLEDVNEPAYRIDRALTQLRLSGALTGAKAMVLGGFTQENGATAGSGQDIIEVLTELTRPFAIPVLAGMPFGHVQEQWCLPLGARAIVDADAGTVEILEPAVA